MFGEQGDVALPSRDFAGRKPWLAAMIELELQVKMVVDHVQQSRQMARQH